MNETMKMMQSLGLYILLAKNAGRTAEEMKAAEDYQDFLAFTVPQTATFAGMFGFTEENPLLTLDAITLTFNQYCALVDQIFGGITQLNALYLPYPPPAAATVPQTGTTYFENYLRTKPLKGDARTPLDVHAIMDRMNEVLMNRADQRVKGLVVGRVQSGKTRNYVGLMLKAIDEGWNVIIVLTSCSTALADQTEDRILKDFKRAGVVHGPKFLKLDFRSGQPVAEPQALAEDGSYAYVGVAMKQVDNLDRILGWLKDYSNYLPRMRVLLVDDEADNATPDSNAGRANQLSDDDVDDLIADIAAAPRSDTSDFHELSDWVDVIRSDRMFTDEDGDPDAPVVRQLKKDLEHPSSATFDSILANADYRRILQLEPYAVRGVTVDVAQEAREYFCNTNGRRSKTCFVRLLNTLLDVVIKRSAINRRVCAFIGKSETTGDYNYNFGRFAYVAYTATPYANMLNERSDQTPLYPDFIRSLHESPQYFGLDKIFGEDLEKPEPAMNIVRFIPTGKEDENPKDELRFVLRPIQGIKDVETTPRRILQIKGPDEDLRVSCDDPKWNGSWATLAEAVAWFFCSAAARRWHRQEVLTPEVETDPELTADEKAKKVNDLERRWTTMLVNVSQIRGVHTSTKQILERYIAKRCSVEHRAEFVAHCKACWDVMTEAFPKSGEKGFDTLFNSGSESENYGRVTGYPSWESLTTHLQHFIEGFNDVNVHILVINSESADSKKNQDRYNQRKDAHGNRWNFENSLNGDHAWIVCGGNTISRGLTLQGLTTSYFDRVRGSAAVDTLTQMGRWFGYRHGYELYPRLWMTQETVLEMKRICVTENRMHETMRENFDAGYDPSDPEHYQQVYYWGRKLSGRQRQLDLQTVGIGTTATTNDLSVEPGDVAALYSAARTFVHGLGVDAVPRSGTEYQYSEMPLWEGVPVSKVRSFLESISTHFPVGSRRKIESLAREIDSSSEAFWDVVLGEPVQASQSGQAYSVDPIVKPHGGLTEAGLVKSGSPNPQRINGYVRYAKSRSDMSFFSMVRRDCLVRADHWVLAESRDDVLTAIRAETVSRGGVLPAQYETAFAQCGISGADIGRRLDAYVEYCDAHPEMEIAPCIRACFAAGYRTRTAMEYFEKVHELARHSRPVLQLFFITPPDGMDKSVPLVSVSFYWPQHSPSAFQVGTVLTPPPPPHPSSMKVWSELGHILANNDFPMTTQKLKDALMVLFPNEPESIYYQNVVDGQQVGCYRSLPGKNAYYSEHWACGEEPKDKLNREIATCAADWLRRQGRPSRSSDVVAAVLQENPRFQGIVDLNTVILNQQVFTDEMMELLGVRKVSGSPVIYAAS